MTFEYGIGMFFFGTSITIIGFTIAFLIANKVVFKKIVKKQTNALDDLKKIMPGWKGDDCQ
tara:strand:- start:289 stop:471 length:183 start_codon:yes stop_codon:yes gene_type:complete